MLNIEQLYKHHYLWLHQWLRKRLGCDANAADITQDTFLRLLDTVKPAQELAQPRAFLRTTAKNLIVDKARRQTIEAAFLEQLSLSMQLDDPHYPSAELICEAIEVLTQLTALLSHVPEKAALAFRLHYLDGMKQQEVARTMKVSARTVRAYLAQVLVNMQRLGIGQ